MHKMSFDLEGDRPPILRLVLSRWRSYRQMHRVLFVVLLTFTTTICILAIFQEELSAKFTLLEHTQSSWGKGQNNNVPSYEEYYKEKPRPPPTAHVPASGNGSHPVSASLDLKEEAISRAGNSTLGFHAIYFINMKNRYDRADAMALQSYIAGIDVIDYPAVEASQIDPAGFPPTQRPGVLKLGEKGCWRAHANVRQRTSCPSPHFLTLIKTLPPQIWQEMVSKKLPPVLIMESDATFDLNMRPIMSNLNKHFVEFLKRIDSKPVHDPSWGSPYNRALSKTPPPNPAEHRVDDPWLSEHWDLFSIGHCFENAQDKNINLVFPDPSVPPGMKYWGRDLNRERVVRRSGGIVCTTSYAISHTGAAKLLLRSAMDLDNPIDLLIRRMTLARDLVAYSVQPPIIAQWGYRGGIGMDERGAQSDVAGAGGPHKDTPADAKMDGWKDVKKDNSIWRNKAHPEEVGFEKMALGVAWDRVMGQKSGIATSMWDYKAGNK